MSRMAARRARIRGGGRVSSFSDAYEDEVELDPLLSPNEKLCLSLKQLVTKTGVTKAKKVAYLNALSRVWQEHKIVVKETESDEGIKAKEIMLCLRVPLTHESAEVRAAALRTLRHIIENKQDVQDLQQMNIHYLIARCLDIDLENKVERIHALRLARKLILLSPSDFPEAVARTVLAVAEGDNKERDKLRSSCLAILCELSVFNGELFLALNGVHALTHALLDHTYPRMTEAIMGVLLRLRNHPSTRLLSSVDLSVVIAPFTEFRYIHDDYQGLEKALPSAEDRDLRYKCGRENTLSLLRSWPGLLHLAEKEGRPGAISPLNALVDVLYQGSREKNVVRHLVLSLLSQSLNVPFPKDDDCTSFDDACLAIAPNHFKDHWKLADGFVAAEGNDILPHLAKSRPNLLDTHHSLLLYCLLRADLSSALVNVIVSTDDALAIKATVLLGEFLFQVYTMLPRELCPTNHCLPSLLLQVSSNDKKRSNRASEAVEALLKIHSAKKRGPTAHSLFLGEILSHSDGKRHFQGQESFVGDRVFAPSHLQPHQARSNDERVLQSIQDSNVLALSGGGKQVTWAWGLVTAVLKWPGDALSGLETQSHRQFVKRVMEYFKPSSNAFAKVELGHKNVKSQAMAGCHLIDFLLKLQAVTEAKRLLEEFLCDITNQLELLCKSNNNLSDCLFSPTRVATTACQYYFLFLGRLSRTQEGRAALDQHSILARMYELISLKSDMYLKLVVSSLDYSSLEWGSRNILQKACQNGKEHSRLYATRFLGVLVRSKTPGVAQWGIDLLVSQLFDKSKIIPWAALDILDEACDDKMNLEAVICALTPKLPLDVDHLGPRGVLITTHFIASSAGFANLLNTGLLHEQLRIWADGFNVQYVAIVEELLNDGFSQHQHNDQRLYGRRSFEAHTVRDSFVPSHLYGKLAGCSEGMELLKGEEKLKEMLNVIKDTPASQAVGDSKLIQLKAAIWAVCNVATSSEGVLFLKAEGVLSRVIAFVEESPVISLRGTAFYALSLVATTPEGSKLLATNTWCTVRYGKSDKWPVVEDMFATDLMGSNVGTPNEREDEILVVEETESSLLSPRTESGVHESEKSFEEVDLDLTVPQATSLTHRQRMSKMFRSFSQGSAKIRRNLYRKSSFSQDSPRVTQDRSKPLKRFSLSPLQKTPTKESAKVRSIPEETPSAIERSSDASEEIAKDLGNIDEELVAPNVDLDQLASANISLEPATDNMQDSFTDSTSGISSDGSLHPPKLTASSAASAKLSPIASANSISTMKAACSSSPSNANIAPVASSSSTSSTVTSCKTATAPAQPAQGATLRVHHRSGQRAHSESEAAHMVIVPDDILDSKSGLECRVDSEGNPISTLQDSIISRSNQPFSMPSTGVRQGQSITSVSSIGSWTDSPGYQTYRSIKTRRRPVLAMTDSTDTGGNGNNGNNGKNDLEAGYSVVRSNSFMRKTRSLDYRLSRQKPTLNLLSRVSGTPHRFSGMSPSEMGPEPRYWGITLPLIYEKIIAFREPSRAAESSFSDNENEFKVESWLSRQQDDHEGLSYHSPSNCLSCFRLSPTNRPRAGSASSHPVSIPPDVDVRVSNSQHSSPVSTRRLRKDSLLGSEESMEGRDGPSTSLRTAQRREVLKLISCMNATVGVKTAEQGLLKMSQRFPEVFNDLCLYSEVCVLLSKYFFRISARRFIQELFLNLQYDELYIEPLKILGLEEAPTHLSRLPEITSD